MGKHSIIVIKNEKNEYLQKYIESWNSYLFPNCKLNDASDTEIIKEYVKNELGVNNIEVDYVGVRKHTKFSVKDQIDKEYIHYFFKVNILDVYELNSNFKWFSYEDLENDKRIMEVNSDIVSFIKELNL